MSSTIFKSIAVLAALGGLAILVWFGFRDPRGAVSFDKVQEHYTNTCGLLNEALTDIRKKGSVGAGADKLKEGKFQLGKSISDMKKLPARSKKTLVEQVKSTLAEMDEAYTELVWTEGIGLDIKPDMKILITILTQVDDLPVPPRSLVSSTLAEGIASVEEQLEEMTNAKAAEDALPKLKEMEESLDKAMEAAEKLSDADKTTITTHAKTPLKKLKDQASKVLANKEVADKIKPTLESILTKLTTLAE